MLNVVVAVIVVGETVLYLNVEVPSNIDDAEDASIPPVKVVKAEKEFVLVNAFAPFSKGTFELNLASAIVPLEILDALTRLYLFQPWLAHWCQT